MTAKAYAAFRRADIVYVPDFIALAAPLLAAFDPTAATDPVERVRELMQHIAAEGPNAWLVAIGLAEAFLSALAGHTLPLRPSPNRSVLASCTRDTALTPERLGPGE